MKQRLSKLNRGDPMENRFKLNSYHIRKQVLTFAGAKVEIFDDQGQVILFSKMKAFKLREDIRVFSGEDMLEEFISIKARSAIDFSAVYDVVDTLTGEKIGALQRNGMKSLLKDEWSILDRYDAEIGLIKEDNLVMALLRRFIGLIPQSFVVEVQGNHVGVIKQNFNPLVGKLHLDFNRDPSHALDRRMALAAGILLCVIEGKQG
jgi:hypothetical protein